jgi:hypothetical protein
MNEWREHSLERDTYRSLRIARGPLETASPITLGTAFTAWGVLGPFRAGLLFSFPSDRGGAFSSPTHAYTCIFICIHINIYRYICMHIYIHKYMYIYIY